LGCPAVINAGIYLVEHAAYQKWLPNQLGAIIDAERFNSAVGVIGPGAGVIEKEFNSGHYLYLSEA
jgi:hypothetical protein